MDAVFSLTEAVRAEFLCSLVHSFGCTYVSLWQYHSNLSNRLFFLDGFYHVMNNQLRSSLGNVPETLFHQYQTLTFHVHDGCVPGVAFTNHIPYLELQRSDLLRLASNEIQAQFFQEARIEIAIFMGCKKGEIELGFSNISQVDIQTALKNLFPEDFYIPSQSTTDQTPHSSSSSSFRSLSLSNPDKCSSLGVVPTETRSQPHQLTQVIPSYFPTPEGEHEALVSAFLRVISSSTSEQHQPHPMLPNYTSDTDFTTYKPHMGSNFRMQNRSFAFFRNLNLTRTGERNIIQEAPSISTQPHHIHMISERRRRERLNENFQELRALLPPGTKKNKASILTTAKDRMRSLMDEIEKLNMRNEQLVRVLSVKEGSSEEKEGKSSNERLNVRVSHVVEWMSSSEEQERMVDLQVTVRGESSQVDVLIRLLKFLEGVQNVNFISLVANNHIAEETPINQLTFRLRIQGSEWEERGFEEAVRRVVADVIQWQLDQSRTQNTDK